MSAIASSILPSSGDSKRSLPGTARCTPGACLSQRAQSNLFYTSLYNVPAIAGKEDL